MRNVLIGYAGLLAFVGGCATNVGGIVSLADARAACDQARALSDLMPMADADWSAFVSSMEALRDDGVSRADAVAQFEDGCALGGSFGSDAGVQTCINCVGSLAEAVWH